MNDAGRLLLFGASVRAAAWSARRSGFEPWGCDLFADYDLAEMASVRRITRYPEDFLTEIATAPLADWIYTGGLENNPDLLDQMARQRNLLGNRGLSLQAARDPTTWGEVLQREGITVPRLWTTDGGTPPAHEQDLRWLLKSRRSSAGRGVRPWVLGNVPRRDDYLQERLKGPSRSGAFLANGRDCRLLAVTEQWVGEPCSGAPPFGYAGSVGPLVCSNQELQQWRSIGQILARECRLMGLFGVDAILVGERDAARVVPVEINPRYTASMEVVERATAAPLMAWHLAACRDGALPTGQEPCPVVGQTWGKAILYARGNFSIDAAQHQALLHRRGAAEMPWLADLPSPPASFAPGDPVLTVFAEGPEPGEIGRDLRLALADLRLLLGDVTNGAPSVA